MTIAPGEKILAADLLGRFRVGTGYEDTDSATFTTTTTAIVTAVADLVSGRTYRVKMVTHIGTSAANDVVSLTLREDTIGGNEIQGAANCPVPTTTSAGHYFQIETDFTAVSTGSKTFVGGAVRGTGGGGNLRREAASARPTILTVDYAYG